jgi:hypothetical protein
VAEFTAEERRRLADRGVAMPDGSFPVRNREDLQNAIRAVGRARPNTEAERRKVRRHIIRRARAIGAESMIPETWNSDGSLSDD